MDALAGVLAKKPDYSTITVSSGSMPSRLNLPARLMGKL
jgi:hypothetical protein